MDCQISIVLRSVAQPEQNFHSLVKYLNIYSMYETISASTSALSSFLRPGCFVRFYIQSMVKSRSAIFNEPVVCPASSSGLGSNHRELLWCFWAVTHPLWVWSRSGPRHRVVETQRSLTAVYFGSPVFWHSLEGQRWGGSVLKARGLLGRYILDLDIFCFLLEELGESLVCPIFGLAWWTTAES